LIRALPGKSAGNENSLQNILLPIDKRSPHKC
jgi:hypothetical protein